VNQRARFLESKVAAEITNHIGTLEVWRESHKRLGPLATRALAGSGNALFAESPEYLIGG
jgi:hypothetical protein